MPKVIKEVKDRKVLNEGRNCGLGFSLLKKIDKDTFETVNPMSPCKDYLSEVVFTENTEIPTRGCGLNYPKVEGILKDKVAYLGFKNMKSKSGHFYVEGKTFEDYSQEVNKGYKNIAKFINKFQEGFDNFAKCTITKTKDNQFLVKYDTRWASSTVSMSLLTLLIRVAKNYDGEMDVLQYLNFIPNNNIDYSLIKTAMANINVILENKKLPKIPEKDIKAIKNNPGWSPHNNGICYWNKQYE